jgi:hypothetical protein
MRIHSKTLKPNYEIIVLPRSDNADVILKAEAVLDFKEFDALVKEPKPKVKIYPGGKRELDTDAKDYRTQLTEYGVLKTNYLYIKSLANTDGLEWENVDIGKPETWGLFLSELESSFTQAEIEYIINSINRANGLDEEHLDKARQSFLLLGQLQAELESIRTGEPENT